MKKTSWLKNRGYLHISPQIDVHSKRKEILDKVNSSHFVSKHAFYPLLHAVIRERRYKKLGENPDIRRHFNVLENKSNAKERPLHYATHIDALIFGKYAELLQDKYEEYLADNVTLSNTIIAYRKIKDPSSINKHKSTIHFAHEVFEEIKARTNERTSVLKYDITSYFSSIDHKLLKKSWYELLGLKCLPDDHYNVFKAATNFSFIDRNDLRVNNKKYERRSGFDEKKLAQIRKSGNICFFESNKDLKEAIQNASFRIYKNPFFRKDLTKTAPIGIPQGLPISAVLSNLYLLEFDRKIVEEVVVNLGGFYRRYSDDIIIICEEQHVEYVNELAKRLISERLVNISDSKTEIFLFKKVSIRGSKRIISCKISNGVVKESYPFTYLGFDFYGHKTLIKSSNLAKFYRRMITAVKRKVTRSVSVSKKDRTKPIVVYRNQLKRLYSDISLNQTKIRANKKRLVRNKWGYYVYATEPSDKKFKSNYFSYAKRASRIMNESSIENQLKKHRAIFNHAINRHIKRAITKM